MAMNDYSPSDIAAMSDGGNGFGGGGWWILLLFILLGGRGWNNGGAGSAGGDVLYPWMENQGNLFNGFAGITQAVTNGFANAETAATARQMADMQQVFGLSQQFAQCCCDNRLATANLTTAISDGIRDVLAAQAAGTQRVLDKLCDQELLAERRENDNLRQQLNMQNLAASQTAQTAQILADNARQTVALEQYLNPTPIPAYQVQNPNCCAPNYGCGCSVA